MQKSQNTSFMSEEVKSKIDLDLKEKTGLIWDTPNNLEEIEEWIQFGFKQIENPDLNTFTPFIDRAKYSISIWSKLQEEGYAIKYDVNYSLTSGGSNDLNITYFYDLNGIFKKQYNW